MTTLAAGHDSLIGYVPPNVRRRLAHGLQELPFEERFSGAVLIADISGFTRMTEEVVNRGPEGAETLSDLLNAYFGRLIDCVDGRGGEVVSFAGDGLIAAWPQRSGEELADVLHQATECALALARTVGDHPAVPDHPVHADRAVRDKLAAGSITLTVRLGVSAGPLRALELGGVGRRRYSVLGGEPLEAASRASEIAKAGQVLVDARGRDLLGSRATGEHVEAGYVRIRMIEPTPVPRRRVEPPTVDAALLAPFIPPPVVSREGIGQGGWLAELRPVTVVFVNLPRIDHQAEPELVQRAVAELQREFDRYEATINDFGVDAKGTSVLAATGLPPLSHDDDPVRAVRAAMGVARVLGKDGWEAGIGVATGRALCGAVGNRIRREYTMMGSAVNTAARLMVHALASESGPVAVLCDAATERATRQRIDWGPRHDLELKGLVGAVAVFEPVRRRTGAPPVGRDTVGRGRERGALAVAVEVAAAGSAQLVVLEGEAGMGKSRLLLETLREAQASGLRCVSGAGDPIERVAPYHAWRSVFASLLDADESAEPTKRAERAVGALSEALRPLAPLLNLILGIELPDSEQSKALQGERRTLSRRRLLLQVLAEAASKPLLIGIDDGHWLDSASWALIQELAGRELPICILLATRPGAGLAPEFDELLAEPTTQRISLAPLDAGQSVAIARERLAVENLPQTVAELITEKSGGNPLFTEELAYALRDSGMIEIDSGRCGIAAGQDLATLALPDTIEGIIGSRIDRLEPQPELVLKIASAVGLTFAPEVIHDVYPLSEERGQIDHSLETLVRRDLTVRVPPQPGVTYSFRHPLTREVAYNRMLFSQRRELHRELAGWFETRFADHLDPVFATLAHHWSRAGDADKGCHYLELASQQALNNGLSREAANLGLRAAELLGEQLPREPESVRTMIAQTMGSIAKLMAGRGVQSIAELPPAADPRKASAIEALLRVGPALFVSQQAELFVLVGLRNFLLTLEHGATPSTPGVVAIYAMILRALNADAGQAFELASLAEQLAERDSPALRAYAGFVNHYFVKHWSEPIGPDLERMRENAVHGFRHEDVMFGCFNSAGHVVQLEASGAPLTDVIAAGTAATEEIAGRVRSAGWHAVHETQLAKALAGRTLDRCSFTDRPEEGTVEEERDLASIMQTDLYDQIGYYTSSKLRLHFLYREYHRAVAFGERAERVLPSFAGQEQEAEFTFLFALALIARYSETGDPETLERARALAQRVNGWEQHAPRVFAHKRLALEAAEVRVSGDGARAAELFAQAAAAADEIGFTQHVALGYELAGRSLVDAGDVPGARVMLTAGRDAYQRWGAHAKVADIDQQLTDLGD